MAATPDSGRNAAASHSRPCASARYSGPAMLNISGPTSTRPADAAIATAASVRTIRQDSAAICSGWAATSATYGLTTRCSIRYSALIIAHATAKYALAASPTWVTTISGTTSGPIDHNDAMPKDDPKYDHICRRGGRSGSRCHRGWVRLRRSSTT